MPRKAKKTTEFDSVDINKRWIAFKEELTNIFDESDYIFASLPFIYLDGKKEYNFAEKEIMFVSDILVENNAITFTCPSGRDYKRFTYIESECVVIQKTGTFTPLNTIIDDLFGKHFPKLGGVNSFGELLSQVKNSADILNKSEQIIQEHSFKIEALKRYEKIPNYGIF